jgi:RNA polymerase sigma factor (sigma-70 family)
MAFSEGVLAALRSRRHRDVGAGAADLDSAGALLISDGELAQEAASGNRDAFEELYRRHVEAAWRVAQAVTNDEYDAADATSEAFAGVLRALQAGRLAPRDHFRSYLIAAARNAAIDIVRRRRRAGRHTPALPGSDELSPVDSLDKDEEAALIARAFRSLPERWRMTLWLTEVEGMTPGEAAPLLGVSGDGARQLAMRARAGLRHRYLQAHVDRQVATECRFAVEHLVTYAGGNLAPRDVAKVDRHLAGCETCRSRLRELDDVGRRLRGMVLPLPLGLAAAVFGKWGKAFAVAQPPGGTGLRWLAGHAAGPLAACCGGLVAVGLVGVTVVGPRHEGRSARPSAAGRATASPAPSGPEVAMGGSAASTPPAPAVATSTAPAAPSPAAAPGASSRPAAPLPSAPPPSPAPPARPPGPSLQAGVAVLPETSLSLGAAAGIGPGSCSGIWLRGPLAGCTPPPPSPAAGPVSVSVQGSLIP